MSTRNFHQIGADALAAEMMRDPKCGALLAETRQRLTSGDIPREYSRVFHQTGHSTAWPVEQVACYLAMHSRLMSGDYVRIDIDLQETPWPDACREENKSVVTTLPHPFVGSLRLDQNSSDWGDGGVRWSEPVVAQRSTNLPTFDRNGDATVSMAPCDVAAIADPRVIVALEIGTSMASVVYGHLLRSRSVARWPYDSSVLTIILEANAFVTGQGDLIAG